MSFYCRIRLLTLLLISMVSFLASASSYEDAARIAWDSVIMAEDEDFMPELREQASSAAVEVDRSSERALELLGDAQSIFQTTGRELSERFGYEDQDAATALEKMLEPGMTYIFVSQGMPKEILHSLFAYYESNPSESVQILISGLMPDQRTIPDAVRSLHTFVSDSGYSPEVFIGMNPTLFNHFDIETVPQIIHVEDESNYYRIKGVVNAEYFLSMIEGASDRDLGVHGTLYEIAERNLLDVIQERIAAIDWEQRRQAMVNNYWDGLDYQHLPPALKPDSFDVDMRIMTTEDIVDEDGQIVHRAGTIIDPAENSPLGFFDRRVIVFNPNNDLHLAWAKEQVALSLKNQRVPLVMLTELHTVHRHNTFRYVEQVLQTRIFLLVPEVVERFHIKAVPATVEQSRKQRSSLTVTEWYCDARSSRCVDRMSDL